MDGGWLGKCRWMEDQDHDDHGYFEWLKKVDPYLVFSKIFFVEFYVIMIPHIYNHIFFKRVWTAKLCSSFGFSLFFSRGIDWICRRRGRSLCWSHWSHRGVALVWVNLGPHGLDKTDSYFFSGWNIPHIYLLIYHKNQLDVGEYTIPRWWFQITFILIPIPGSMIQFDEHIFQMGWLHQLVFHFRPNKVGWFACGVMIWVNDLDA